MGSEVRDGGRLVRVGRVGVRAGRRLDKVGKVGVRVNERAEAEVRAAAPTCTSARVWVPGDRPPSSRSRPQPRRSRATGWDEAKVEFETEG